MMSFQIVEQATVRLHVFYPEKLQRNAAVFLVRGGDWRSREAMRLLHPLAAACAEHGYPAAVADYPSDAKDALAQLASLRQSYHFYRKMLLSFGMSPRILVFGMGAGAHLGALLTCARPGECGEEASLDGAWEPPVAGCFLSCPLQFTPWEGLFPRTWQMMQDIAGVPYAPDCSRYERLSVKDYLREGMPPIFLAEGAEDHVGTALVSRGLAEECRARHLPVAWKCYPLAGPSFLSVLDWGPSRMLLEDLFRFFDAQAGEGAAPKAAFPKPEGAYGLYLDSPAQPLRGVDIYLPPKGKEILPTALFLVHGGGWRAGDRSKLGELAAAFAERGILTASAGYRLRAHDAFEQLADLRGAYDAFVGELERLGRPMRIAVYGESAGAHLVSLLAATPPGGCGEECHLTRKWIRPVAMILQSAPTQFTPWKDISPAIWLSMEDIAGAPYARDPERYTRLSLDHYIGKDTPAVFFAEAEFEVLFPVEMTRTLAEKLKRFGVPVKMKRYRLAEHGFFYTLQERSVQREFFEDIVQYLSNEIPAPVREDAQPREGTKQ